jgi:hypothetical protein
MKTHQSIAALLTFLWSASELSLADANGGGLLKPPAILFRGGSTRLLAPEADLTDDDESQQEEVSPEVLKKRQIIRKYRIDQQMLMQLRSTMLSEALAKRGLPMITIMDVSTAEGDKPPEIVDWDCAMSTPDEPKVRMRHGNIAVESQNVILTPQYRIDVPIFF